MAYSNYGLNQRINNLYAILNGITSGSTPVPTSSNFAHILDNGNSAGTNDIDMNQQDIVNGNEIFLGSNSNSIEMNGGGSTITISDNLGNQNVITAIGSSVPSANADSVLTTATSSNATFYPSFLGATTGYNSVGVSTALQFNPSTKTETLTDGVNSTIITPTSVSSTTFTGDLSGNATSSTTTTNLAGGIASQIPYQSSANTTAFIANGTSGQYLKSNGTSAPSWETIPVIPPTSTLSQVLTAGNSAGATDIDMNNQSILQVDNIDVSTINGSAYPPATTTPTLEDVLNAGNIAQNDLVLNSSPTTTTSIYLYPTLSAPEIILTDGTTTNTINKSGYTTRNSVQNSTHYINFSDSSSTGTGAIQKTAGIECNPSTKTITATTFVGDLSGNATTATTATNTTNTAITATSTNATYYPTFVSATTGNLPQLVDTTLTYNPSTDTLTCANLVGNASSATTATTATTSTNIAGGAGGSIPYQSSANNTALLANGSVGQVLTSSGTTLPPTWTTITAGSNASTINITDTTTTAGTYYPTFVSSTGSTQTLRADSQYLKYNPSTNYLQNPSFLVSNGTETSTTGGLLISTGGIGSKSIFSTTTTGATENALTIQTTNSGNASSGIYEIRQSGTGSGNGVAPLTLPLWSLSSSFFTPVSPVGTPYSTGNYYMLGSCCNMATQLVPNGAENGIVAGFQTSIGDNNGYADMYYNTDQYTSTNPYILRLNSAGLLAYGTGTAGTYTFGSQNPSTLATTLFSVDSAGVATTNSVSLSNAPTTANQASRLGQVGLVKIGSVSVAITGSASAQNLSFANLFNSSYKNYRIILEPTTQVSFTQYPSYSLQAFLGTGTLPTTASLYGFEITSASTAVVSPVYTAGATISSAPLTFAVSSNTNKEVIFDIQNVGYANTATQQVSLMCKSVYGNPGVSGASDRTITCSSASGATITGLVIQQSILSSPNNFTLRAVIYGYNQL